MKNHLIQSNNQINPNNNVNTTPIHKHKDNITINKTPKKHIKSKKHITPHKSKNNNISTNSESETKAISQKNTNQFKDLIVNNFVSITEIGHGAFGQIFLSFNIRDNIEVAIKKEYKKPQKIPQLQTEAKIYQTLLNIPTNSDISGASVLSQDEVQGITRFYGMGELTDSYYLIIEFLGPNLIELLNYCGMKRFTIVTVCLLALQILNRVEYLHKHNYIHRDIKPENFLIGTDNKSNIIYLVDFGLSKRYKNPKNHQHIPYREGRFLTGTARYVSINTHLGVEQSRRDDLESVGYVLIFFLKGSLPWQGLKTGHDKYTRIMEKKLQIPTEILCYGLPDEVSVYLNYCKSLRFEDRPDYDYLRSLFIKILNDTTCLYGISKEYLKFDWCFEDQKLLWELYNKDKLNINDLDVSCEHSNHNNDNINNILHNEESVHNEKHNKLNNQSVDDELKSNENDPNTNLSKHSTEQNNNNNNNNNNSNNSNGSSTESNGTIEIEFNGLSQAALFKQNVDKNDSQIKTYRNNNNNSNSNMNIQQNFPDNIDEYINNIMQRCKLPKTISIEDIIKKSNRSSKKGDNDTLDHKNHRTQNKNLSLKKIPEENHVTNKLQSNSKNLLEISEEEMEETIRNADDYFIMYHQHPFKANSTNYFKQSLRKEEINDELNVCPKLQTYKKKLRRNLIDGGSSKFNTFHIHLAKENLIKISSEPYTKHYIVLNDLGQGSYGKVKRVRHIKLNEIRAMKIVSKKSSSSSNEIQALRKISHPNIVNIHEIFEDTHQYYIMSEYCEGGELFDAITSKGFYSELDAAKIIKQILQAVTYLHDNNIIHRDLKPENIMLLSNKNNETSLKLIDFGTVVEKPKFGNKLTKFIGTSYYIAPEVIKESYDEKCDVWSCGIILYILLCGYPPFNGASNHEIYNAIKFSKLIFQKEEWTDISKEAIELITFMLDKNPSTRPSAYECLNHKWFKVCEGNISHTFLHSNTLITNKTKLLDSMARFVQQNKFKQAVLQFISTEFNLKKEEEELKKMFKEFDNEDKGTISREVFIKQIEKLEGGVVSRDIISEIFTRLDLDGSGNISYNEFLTSIIDGQKILTEDRLEKAFKTLDRDENGFLSIDEIKSFFGGDEETWKKVLREVDKNGDGEVDFEEFKIIMIGFDPKEIVGEATIRGEEDDDEE